MIQGCGSNVGKSMLVAGLARAYANRGLRVAPFKPQNMSNNAAVTEDGGEIGRAQALQAFAARAPMTVHMNPVLLKPETERGAQVVLQGKRLRHATARDYTSMKPKLLKGVIDSFEWISAAADLVLIEGAGSPAEVNLRSGDIANMGFAGATKTPVILTGDIDRGGATTGGSKKVVCLQLSRIANFDDLDPLRAEPDLNVEMLPPSKPIPGDATLVIIPGSKSTRGDLAFLREQGWDIDLMAHRRRGGMILGLCGGYQMLGKTIIDREGIEGSPGESVGLGMLDLSTEMTPQKSLTRILAVDLASGEPASGYEIHIGRTEGPDRERPLFRIGQQMEGAQSPDGRVLGTYLHGLFAEDGFRRKFLGRIGAHSSANYGTEVDATLDTLAAHLEKHIDLDGLLALANNTNE
ncbi:UNVERIFIED_CONTAM: hypothetical protein GTU68_035275 [Idotea baltica]|nr:hypothetical protein [Idotea baltica]